MDYFAHGFWSYIFFHWLERPWLAVIFGLLPDNLSWGIFLVYNIVTDKFPIGSPNAGALPKWVMTLYGISHSLIICACIFLIVYLIFKKIPWYMYAWPIAIIMDVPTHSREFLPTPFLWPFEWYFPGFSWGNAWFMILNYILIAFFLLYVAGKKITAQEIKSKKKKSKKK